MSNPNVSICIPAYNQPESLRRLLTSICEQAFTDYEVIVTDDSTTDAVSRVVADFPSVRYHKNKESKGPAANWNKAISLAHGDYIKVMHHDDWFATNESLGKFVRMLDEHPDAYFAFSAADAFDAHKRFKYRHTPTDTQIANLTHNPKCLFKGNFVGAPSATIMRRGEEIHFDESLKWLVDIELYMRLLRSHPAFAYSSEPLVDITVGSPDQVTAACAGDRCVDLREHFYVYDAIKNGASDIVGYFGLFWSLFDRTGVVFSRDIYVCDKGICIPRWVSIVLLARFVSGGGFLKRAIKHIIQLFRKVKGVAGRLIDWKKSYSQCGEDLIVEFLFSWLAIDRPVYLDIGAHHPTYLSNTYRLYRSGHSGVTVEPDPSLYKRIKAVRPKDISLNVGVGIGNERSADFYIMTTRTLNTFSKEEAERYASYGNQRIESVVSVPLLTVNEIIGQYCKTTPNFVSLDVEGFDLPILKSFDFDRYRPEIFCIETLTFTENNTEEKLHDIIDFMKSKGYFVYADTYINTIFVDSAVWNARKKA